MAISKNRGPLLTSRYLGSVDNFPKEFLALIGIDVLAQHVPVDIDIDPITGLLVESKVVQERDNERRKTNTYLTEFPDGVLESQVKLPSGLIGTRTRRLVSDPTTLIIDNLTDSADQNNLGNGWLDQTIVEAPSLFEHFVYRRTRPDVTPQDFGALLQTDEVTQTQFGDASDPVLVGGDISASDEQVDVWTHRTSRATIDVDSLPRTIVNRNTNQYKQYETITRILELESTTPATPTALQDVVFTKLGDGTALEIRTAVPNVFAEERFSRERPVVTPEDFRALLQEQEHSEILAGDPADPTLTAGQISVSDAEVTELTHRLTERFIDILALPATIVNKNTNQYKQTETITRILELDSATPAVPTALRDVVFTKLGDGTALEIHTDIPNIFAAERFSRERPVVTPQDFRALLQEQEHSEILSGSPTDPTLSPGQISVTDDEVTELTHRLTERFIDVLSLPVTIVNKSTNQFKQVETITRILELDSTTPATPTALRDVVFTKLGDGTALEVRTDIPSVFDGEKFSRERGIVTPQDFRALLQEQEHSEILSGQASDPSLTSGQISVTDENLTVLTHRLTERSIDLLSLPVTIVNKDTNQYKQVETITRILELDSTTPAVPTALRKVSFTKLGDGTALEVRTDVPSVFDQIKYTRERPVVTPADFRALLEEQEVSEVLSGNAVDPTLTAGQIQVSDEQLTVFEHRLTERTIDSLSLPATLVNKRTNQFKQVETVTRILELASTTPAVPTALMDVTFTKLGDGTALEERISVPSLFDHITSSINVLSFIPPEFRGLIPDFETSEFVTGIVVDPPVLTGTQIYKQEEQTDVFNKKVTTRNLGTPSLPITYTNKKLGGFQFGGEVMKQILTLDDSALTIEQGVGVVSSETKTLSASLFLLTTEKWDTATEWPTLIDTLYDEDMRVFYEQERQVVEDDYIVDTGAGFVETKQGLDKWRAQRTKVTRTPTATDEASALISYEFRPFKFPGTLNAFQASLSNNQLGYRQTKAELVQVKVKTWWENSATAPTPTFDEIIPDSISVAGPDNTQTYHDVLHDAWTTHVFIGGQTQAFAATTPSYTEYYSGTPSGTFTDHNLVAVATLGSGYEVGDILTIGAAEVQLLSVGLSGTVGAYLITDEGVGGSYSNPVAASGGSGSGATFNVFPYNTTDYTPGTAWVGTERVIGATVTKEKEQDLWKIQTFTVVMR